MYSIITPRTGPSHNPVTLTIIVNNNNIFYVCECESLTGWRGCSGVVCKNGGGGVPNSSAFHLYL